MDLTSGISLGSFAILAKFRFEQEQPSKGRATYLSPNLCPPHPPRPRVQKRSDADLVSLEPVLLHINHGNLVLLSFFLRRVVLPTQRSQLS